MQYFFNDFINVLNYYSLSKSLNSSLTYFDSFFLIPVTIVMFCNMGPFDLSSDSKMLSLLNSEETAAFFS